MPRKPRTSTRKAPENRTPAQAAANARRHAEEAERLEKLRSERADERRDLHTQTVRSFHPPLGEFIEAFTECDEKLFDMILQQMGEGWVFSRICHEFGIRKNIVQRYIREDDERSRRYELARKMQAEAWADDLVALADNSDEDSANTTRMQINVRQWLMSKNHARYTDRSTLALEGGDPAKPLRNLVSREMTETEAMAAYQETLRRSKGEG